MSDTQICQHVAGLGETQGLEGRGTHQLYHCMYAYMRTDGECCAVGVLQGVLLSHNALLPPVLPSHPCLSTCPSSHSLPNAATAIYMYGYVRYARTPEIYGAG